MTAQFRGLIGKVATGATLTREEAAGAFEQMMSGEATPSQMGALLMGLRVRGETVDEITGAVTAMRAKMVRVAGAAQCHRRGRHRRRRLGLVQHFDLRGADRRRRRRAGRQARQSRAVVEIRRRRRARSARASISIFRRKKSGCASARPASASCSRRRIIRRPRTSRRPASSSAPAPSSICSGRSPTRPACGGR